MFVSKLVDKQAEGRGAVRDLKNQLFDSGIDQDPHLSQIRSQVSYSRSPKRRLTSNISRRASSQQSARPEPVQAAPVPRLPLPAMPLSDQKQQQPSPSLAKDHQMVKNDKLAEEGGIDDSPRVFFTDYSDKPKPETVDKVKTIIENEQRP